MPRQSQVAPASGRKRGVPPELSEKRSAAGRIGGVNRHSVEAYVASLIRRRHEWTPELTEQLRRALENGE